MRGLLFLGVLDQRVVEKTRGKNVNAHRGKRHVRVAGYRIGILRFFRELGDTQVLVDGHHTEFCRLGTRNLDTANGEIGTGLGMVHDHLGVVHGVDVVATKHHHIVRTVNLDDIEVLVERIGSSLVPLFLRCALLCGKDFDKFTDLRTHEGPGPLKMTDERMRLVLGQNTDAPQSGVHTIRQGKVDDAVLAAERHCRLGPPACQSLEA